MANQYINVYKGSPTEGGTDGILVSEGNDMSEPIAVTLNATLNEVKTIKLAIRCQPGFQTSGSTIIQDNNDTDDRWKFSLAEGDSFADSISIDSDIGSINTVFWARASSSSLEAPTSDSSVSIKVTAPVRPVS